MDILMYKTRNRVVVVVVVVEDMWWGWLCSGGGVWGGVGMCISGEMGYVVV